jgi:hypothetical protein
VVPVVRPDELMTAIFACARLLRFDAEAVTLFDNSVEGFWKSFNAAAVVAPLYLILLLVSVLTGEVDSPLRFIAAEAIAYVAGWVAFPLAMVYIARHLGRDDFYLRYIVAFNWFQVPQAMMMMPVSLLGAASATPNPVIFALGVGVLATMLMYEWFIARTALQIDGAAAAALVLIDLLLKMLISGVAQSVS